MKNIAILAFLFSMTVTSAQAAEYVIDGAGGGMHTAVSFKASHIGISSLWGRYNDITGHFSYDADDIEASSIEVTIRAASIDTNLEARDEHLRTSDYLEVSTYPTATFASSSVEDLGNGRFQVNGTFSMHGVSRDISFEAWRTGEGETPFGDYRVGLEGELVLDFNDYGINVGDVAIFVAIEGIRQ